MEKIKKDADQLVKRAEELTQATQVNLDLADALEQEVKSEYAQANEDCETCEGSGVQYMQNGEDDCDAEVCICCEV